MQFKEHPFKKHDIFLLYKQSTEEKEVLTEIDSRKCPMISVRPTHKYANVNSFHDIWCDTQCHPLAPITYSDTYLVSRNILKNSNT